MKVELRDPNKIMKLSRLGSFHQSKLSFLRSFLNEFKEWEYKRDLFNLNENGFGEAVYSFKKNKRVYSLICFANEIKDEERSDRVIATKWDAAFTLHDGVPTKKDIERLKNEVPKQEIGRLSYKELTLSRANKSVRIYNHVVESLSKGQQPDLNLLSKVGYLYRTTAVYGSGKFGLADRFRIKNRKVYAKYSFAKRFEGGPGLVHGGILSAALDDMMGYSTVIHNIFSVTANLSVNFLKPTPVEKDFELYAWVKEVDNKKVFTEAVIQLGEQIHVEAHGMFIDLGLDAAEFFAPDKNYP